MNLTILWNKALNHDSLLSWLINEWTDEMTDDILNNDKKCYDRKWWEQCTSNKNNFEDDEIFLKMKTIMITAMMNEWNLSKKSYAMLMW